VRVEQLPVQFITRQATPPAFTEDIQYRFGALHYAYPTVFDIHHLAPFALLPAFPDSSAGRYSCDYYGACVAIGFASLRRSHVRLCHTSERDLGALFVPFNALTGHRSPPWRLRRPACHAGTGRGAGFRRLSGGWTIASSGDWDSGNPAIHRIARAPQHVVPYAWTRPLICCHAAVPVFPFGSRLGIRPRNNPPSSSPLNRGYDRAHRGASCSFPLNLSASGKPSDPRTSLQSFPAKPGI
jgi:hypothetical protein